MGDSDRMKNYISDYLENSLDPSTHKKFEEAMKGSPELRMMTDRVAAVSKHLRDLKTHNCSDDFSIKLRERIHTTSEPLLSRRTLIRYSFAASLIIIIVIATLTISNMMSDSPETAPALQGSTKDPLQNANPVSKPDNPGTLVDEGDLDIKSKSNQNAIGDSTKVLEDKKKNNLPVKYVDQEE